MGFFRKRVKLMRQEKQKINLEETQEYEYCRIFVDFCETLHQYYDNVSKAVINWNNDTKTLSFELKLKDSEEKVEHVYQNMQYQSYIRLTEEIQAYKTCRVEKCLYIV